MTRIPCTMAPMLCMCSVDLHVYEGSQNGADETSKAGAKHLVIAFHYFPREGFNIASTDRAIFLKSELTLSIVNEPVPPVSYISY